MYYWIDLYSFSNIKLNPYFFFLFPKYLIHFKRAFLIKICPLSVVVVVVVVVNCSNLHLLLQNHWTNSNQTCHKSCLDDEKSSLFKWRAPPFSKGDSYEIAKIHWQNLNIFFWRTTWPISTKLGTNHLWVTGIQVCSNKGPRPFPRRYNFEIRWRKFKNLRL